MKYLNVGMMRWRQNSMAEEDIPLAKKADTTSLASRTTTLEGDVLALDGTVNSLGLDLGLVTRRTSSLEGRATNLETTTGTLTTNLGLVEGRITVLEADTETARDQAVTARDEAVTARDQAVTAKNLAEGFAGDAAAFERSALGAAESAEANALLTSTHVLETRAARDRAEAARTEAAGSADVAVAARDDAGNAALAAEAARDAAQAAENAAELYAANTETLQDNAVAGLLTNAASETGAALANRTVGVQKKVQGGEFPKPIRVPTLLTKAVYPNPAAPGISRILWAENAGQTLYGYAGDASLYKSLDGGDTWTHVAYLNWAPALQGAFLKTGAGTLLTIDNGSTPKKIRRSNDDGATWTVVGELRAGWTPLGPQSWDIDPTTGTIYLGEYGDGLACRLWKSTDDGATWTVHYDFPGRGSTDPDKIRHIHAVQWDPYGQFMWICVGDSLPTTGFWKVTPTGVEEVLTNRMLPAGNWDQGGFFDAPRAIGIMPFPDYVAWASDSTSNPGLFRVARSELGSPTPVVERIYRTNSTNWFTCKASGNGSRWVFSSSQEARTTHAIDTQVHLYAVEDQGATVYEVAGLPQMDDSMPAGSLMPVGVAQVHGDTFVLTSRNTGMKATWTLALASSGSAELALPVARPPVAAWQTLSAGEVEIPASGTVVLGYDVAAAFARKLRIFNLGVTPTDGTVGRAGIRVVIDSTDEVIATTQVSSLRQNKRMEWSPYIAEALIAPAARVRFELFNMHANTPCTAIGRVTYGWAS